MSLPSFLASLPLYITLPASFLAIFFVAHALARHRARPKRLRDGVDGTGHIVSVSTYGRRGSSTQGLVTLDLVIEAPGVPAVAIKYKRMIMVPRWPRPGDIVPVSVDPRNPNRCVILWGELPDPVAIGDARAQQLAAELRASHGTSPGRSTPSTRPSTGDRGSGESELKLRVDASGASIVGADGARRRVGSLDELDPSLEKTVRSVWDNAANLVNSPDFVALPPAKQQHMRDIVANLGYLFR
ncbi:hypothetical protein C5B96_02760 [Subtercola sp. Z020]|uniref:hypothetical protein n=1 Tax=Subtercola sp. Z020 TaxID=2080582 RepID=UPI000CE8963C|nr:hypothetical protein [Subtercola sp. Z020]PPF88270.1 hypothetical protein C5B96_02760 [Subtercola sp. Z020]